MSDITVSVTGGSGVTVDVTGSTAAADVAVSGATASVSVTSVGDRGPTGSAGPVNVISIGQVITGAPGSDASATISGTPPNQTLSLSIPRGDVGQTGSQGTQGVPGNVGPAGPAGPSGPAGPGGTFADAQSINAQTASYTLVLSDAGKLIAANHTSTAITITVPAGSSVAFPVGTHIDLARLGAAAVSVVGASGVTVDGTPGLKLRAQYSAATLIEIANDSWLLVGDLSA